jgi:hypothetical protein
MPILSLARIEDWRFSDMVTWVGRTADLSTALRSGRDDKGEGGASREQ